MDQILMLDKFLFPINILCFLYQKNKTIFHFLVKKKKTISFLVSLYSVMQLLTMMIRGGNRLG